MDKAKNMIDSVIDSQSKIINNWVDTTKKMQRAAIDGAAAEKGGNLYNEWLENQMSIFKNISLNNSVADGENPIADASKVEDYFKNWYNSQITMVKQMTDFNQQLYSQMSNAGKPQTEINEQFQSMNNAWTNMYSNWTNTLNNTFENLSSTMKNGLNKDMFSSMYHSNNVFMKMNETFQPMMKAFNSNGFNAEQLKNMMTAEFYKNMTEKMFEGFFPKNDFTKMFETIQTNMKNMMGNSTSFSKEIVDNYNNAMKNIPAMFTNLDMTKMMHTSQEMLEAYNKPFAQMMKMMAPGKEKQMLENMVETMDKINVYQTKQAQLQYLLYTTAQKAMENSIKNNFDKTTDGTEITNFNQFFTEWVSTNENAYTSLFATEEFSQLKAEVTALGMSIKKDYDNQLVSSLENTPFAFKSDMDEVYKNLYDLKKMVKQMQKMLEINVEEEVVAEEKTASKTKKK
jgi:hypothetical protein